MSGVVTVEVKHEALGVLRDFLAALNQWQRNVWRRHRLDNYEFNNPSPCAVDRSIEQLQQDWVMLADRFISPKCRFHANPPRTKASPPVFEAAEGRLPITVATSEFESIFEVAGSLGSPYRFVLVKADNSWLVHDLLVPAGKRNEPWKQGHII